jgi:hypothetical protein
MTIFCEQAQEISARSHNVITREKGGGGKEERNGGKSLFCVFRLTARFAPDFLLLLLLIAQ